MKQLESRWLKLARSLSATRLETLLRVILPGIFGHVLTGVRLAIDILDGAGVLRNTLWQRRWANTS